MGNRIFLKPNFQFWVNGLWRLLNRNLISAGGGRPAGGALMLAAGCQCPRGEEATLRLPQEAGFLLYSSRGKEDLLLARQQRSQWRAVTTQPMKSHHTSNRGQLPPMDSWFTMAPLSSPFLYKRTCLSLVLWKSPRSVLRLHLPSCNPLLFPNKPIALEKYLAGCYFKVNSLLKLWEWGDICGDIFITAEG